MNNIVANFDQVLAFASQMEVPIEKRRGVIREYLQAKFISILYSFNETGKLSFVGGTGLRLLRNLDRFSEDLDFDNLGLSEAEIVSLIEKTVNIFEKENILTELSYTAKGGKTYFNLKFPFLLKELGISTNPKEKLRIKIDYSWLWKGQEKEVVLLSKYGPIEQVVTNTIDQILTQKLAAYVQRKQTQPRDLYDVVWLFAQGAGIDNKFAKRNGLENLPELAREKVKKEGIKRGFKNKLRPFLFKEENVRKIDLFEKVLLGL